MVGLVAGAGALLRGNLLVLLPAIALWPLVRARVARERLSGAAISAAWSLAGMALVLLPVFARNYAVGGEFALSTSGAGTNIYGGNNLDNPYGVATEFAWVRGVPEHEADDWKHEAQRRTGEQLTVMQVSAYWRDAALASMREQPLEHAKILWRKLRISLGAYEVPDNHFLEWDARYVAPLRWPWPGFALIGPWALIGVALLLVRRKQPVAEDIDRAAAREVALLAALYLGTVVLTVTSDRIRYALVPLLLPFAAHTVVLFAAWLRRPQRLAPLSLCGLAALSLACTAFVWTPVISASDRAKDFDERDFNLAAGILRTNGSLSAAEELTAVLDARYPKSVRVDLLQSEIDYRRAREILDTGESSSETRALAEARLDAALGRLKDARARSRPQELFRVHVLAGAIQQYLGQFAAAARHYANALEFDPEDADVLRRRGVCLANAAMQQPPGAQREKGLDEALAILDALPNAASDAELARLIAQIRAAR
jgi:hypothetical protein